MNRFLLCVTVAFAFLMGLGGCSLTRYDRLVAKGDKVEANLKLEQKKALALDAASAERSAKLTHLTSLRNQLSAANMGLSAVKHVVPPEQKDIGYDVIEQVFDTIDWNIPLADTDPGRKAMPSQFSNGVLKLN